MPVRLYQEGLDFGVGFDSLSHRARGWAVERLQPLPTTAGGAQVTFNSYMITDHAELRQSLGVTTSASLSYKVVGEGSLEAKFLDTHKIDQYSAFLLVQVTVINAQQRLADVRL